MILSYISLSMFFFYFPQLIHRRKYLKKKANSHNFVVIGNKSIFSIAYSFHLFNCVYSNNLKAHRGGACEAVENTFEAFEK